MLTSEWKHRVEWWRKELPNHFYQPLGALALEGYVTQEQLEAAAALKGPFAPMPTGVRWGAKWEYGWFKGEVTLPEAAAGKRIALAVDVGAESAIYVNGESRGALDHFHKEITLSMAGVPGTRYAVLVEAYGGHGPVVVSVGPLPPDRQAFPDPEPTQRTVGKTTFGVWEDEVYQLWLDVETLYQLRENLDPESLRVAEIDAGLRDFTVLLDLEAPRAEMLAQVAAARARLKPLLECVNGSTAPEMFGFGHAHIDVAWLWPLAETERKCVRTFSTQLSLMEEYPEYKFLQSQPHLYRMVKQHYPDLYARIQEAVKSGGFIPEGGAWVEPDTNVAGGEALIRQFVHGKRFFKEEFGVESEMLWLPDVFGYSGALPQIMRGCGIRYFSTQKIFWAYHGGEMFPYNTFIWEGIDGSEIHAHMHNDYNATVNPQSLINRWRERVQKDGIATRLYPFGYGDGGGGATRNHLEFARRLSNLEGAPKFKVTHPLDFFRDQERRGWPTARYVGELYFQAHRGTYTSQARTKRGNRQSELALREAEMWGVAARALKGHSFSAATLDEPWKMVLLNQFHDILPGSSIQRVYEEAEASYAEVLKAAQAATAQATACLAGAQQHALTAFNSLSWTRRALVALPAGWQGASDGAGKSLPTQSCAGKLWAEATIPACGWTTLRPADAAPVNASPLKAEMRLLENELLRVEFNAQGEIVSLYDKERGELVAQEVGPCNRFKMYQDIPAAWDAWDLDSIYEATPVALEEEATFEVIAAGPLMVGLRITRKLHHSLMTQQVWLRSGSRRIDFETQIDWQEKHKLLKVAFPVQVHANEALHEIQFGHIRRPNHRSRPFDADRFEVSQHKWTALAEENHGCAVLNDCKYGVNVLGKSINLTLLKAAQAPDRQADLGMQTFTYAFYAWNGSFGESELVREGYDLNVPVVTAAGDGGEQSLFAVDAANIVIEAVKPAEDGSNDIVVRLYEAMRMSTTCALSTPLPVASVAQTTMLEEVEAALECVAGKIALTFRPFEIKTLRLRLA